jgi:hypothetical protein
MQYEVKENRKKVVLSSHLVKSGRMLANYPTGWQTSNSKEKEGAPALGNSRCLIVQTRTSFFLSSSPFFLLSDTTGKLYHNKL